MNNNVGALNQAWQSCLVADKVALDKLESCASPRLTEELFGSGREVIEDLNRVASGQQFISQVRPDEARTTCYDDTMHHASEGCVRQRFQQRPVRDFKSFSEA